MSLGTKLNAVQRRGIAAALHHAQQARDWAARHPRRVALAVLSLLGSFAVTAVAIAPLAPDAAKLPQQLVTEAVTPEPLAAQLEALSAQPLQLWRSEITRGTDTADSLLKRLGVADPLAARFIRSDRTARRLLEGRGGKMVRARTETDGTLVELVARFPALDSAQQHTHFTRLTLSKVAGQWLAQIENAPLQVRVQLGSGTIRSTLFGAIDEANLPDSVATQLVEMFANDIDFHRELRRGDTFSVVYEGLVADDQPVSWGEGAGRVLAAEFINKGKAHQAVLFEQNGKPTYFGFDGQNKRRSFLASPLEFSRLTSGFAMRFHPIHQVWKQHRAHRG
jgi:murein DD-endopeptidase MepM/ murein hydrolase activator NlpD